jgi:hypothetical protein
MNKQVKFSVSIPESLAEKLIGMLLLSTGATNPPNLQTSPTKETKKSFMGFGRDNHVGKET